MVDSDVEPRIIIVVVVVNCSVKCVRWLLFVPQASIQLSLVIFEFSLKLPFGERKKRKPKLKLDSCCAWFVFIHIVIFCSPVFVQVFPSEYRKCASCFFFFAFCPRCCFSFSETKFLIVRVAKNGKKKATKNISTLTCEKIIQTNINWSE